MLTSDYRPFNHSEGIKFISTLLEIIDNKTKNGYIMRKKSNGEILYALDTRDERELTALISAWSGMQNYLHLSNQVLKKLSFYR